MESLITVLISASFCILQLTNQVFTAEDCSEVIPLGLSSGVIPKKQLHSPSFYRSNVHYNVDQARLRIRGSYCGNNEGASLWTKDYLQVDFNSEVLLTGIAIQGDFYWPANFITSFYLASSNDGKAYVDFQDGGSARKVFPGNKDNDGIKFNAFVTTMKTRFVQIHGVTNNRADGGALFCLRAEFYGCHSKDNAFGGPKLYPLGLENGIVPDDKMLASNENYNQKSYFARLNYIKGWCAKISPNEWLQIDFQQPMTITGVSVEGHGDRGSTQMVSTFYLQYSLNSASYQYVKDKTGAKKEFLGPSDGNQQPVFNRIEKVIVGRLVRIIPKNKGPATSQYCLRAEIYGNYPGNEHSNQNPVFNAMPSLVESRLLRIIPISAGPSSKMYCLRAEVYGHHQECADSLTKAKVVSLKTSSGAAPDPYLYSKAPWCATTSDSSQFIEVHLNKPYRISGIAIQGDPATGNYVKSFQIKYTTACGQEKDFGEFFTGNKDPFGVVRHWLKKPITSSKIAIKPVAWQGKICLRLQLLGCREIAADRIPLGLASGIVKSNQMSAQSVYVDSPVFDADQGRLRIASRWCGNEKGTANFKNDWHQTDFGRSIMLTGVALQGDPSYRTNFVKRFSLEIGDSASSLTPVKDIDGSVMVFDGNIGNTDIKYNWLKRPVSARVVRFKAVEIQRIDSAAHTCARLEYYGSGNGADLSASKKYYALGMESGAIKKGDLSSSGHLGNSDSHAPTTARLNGVNGWCPNVQQNDQWLQIGFHVPMVITAVATQGHGFPSSTDRVKEYYISYANKSGNEPFKYVMENSKKKLFVGNVKTNHAPVLNLLPQYIVARYIRINPQSLADGSKVLCMRVELFGYNSVCYTDLSKSPGTKFTASSCLDNSPPGDAYIYSPVAWCGETAGSHLDIDFGKTRVVSGIGLQGDSNDNNWVTQYKVAYGESQSSMKDLTETYTGNYDRNSVVRVWFKRGIQARIVKIRPTSYKGKPCLRAQVLGCNKGVTAEKPQNVTVRMKGVKKADVSWIKAFGGPFLISKYIIEYGETNEDPIAWSKVNMGADVSVKTIDALVPYRHYAVRVQTIGIFGLSGYGNSTLFTTNVVPDSYPDVVGTSRITVDSFTVSWKKPAVSYLSDWDIKGYFLVVKCAEINIARPCSQVRGQNITVSDVNVSTRKVTVLMPWTNYTVSIALLNGAGSGKPSPLLQVTTGEALPGAVPTNLTTALVNSTFIILAWSPIPVEKQNGIISFYAVNFVNLKTGMRNQSKLFGVGSTGKITGLKPFTNYTFSIAAATSGGLGNFSDSITVQTLEAAPSESPSFTVANVNRTSVDITVKKISVENENGVVLGYAVKYTCIPSNVTRDCPASSAWTQKFQGYTERTFQLQKLRSWMKYGIQVSVYTKAGTGVYGSRSEVTTLEEKPSAGPENVQIVPKSPTEVYISWKPVIRDKQNGVVHTYKLAFSSSRSPLIVNKTITAPKTTLSLKDLKPYTNYTVRIAAVNKAGTGPFTDGQTTQTLEAAPGAVIVISGTNATTNGLTFSVVNIDESKENGKLLGYILTYQCVDSNTTRKCDSTKLQTKKILGAPKKMLVLDKLRSWTLYKTTIQIFNKAGPNNKSKEIAVKTEEEVPKAAPAAIVLSNIEDRSMLIKWNPITWDDGNGILTFYTIKVEDLSFSTMHLVNAAAAVTTYNVTTVKPYRNYSLSVAARNAKGIGPYSSSVKGTTKDAAPSAALSITRVDNGKDNLTIYLQNLNKTDENGILLGYHLHFQCVNLPDKPSFICPNLTKRHKVFKGAPRSYLFIDGLTSWTRFQLQVSVYNGKGASPLSSPTVALTLVDKPKLTPSNFRVEVKGPRKVHVSWDPISNDKVEGVVTGYRIQFSSKRWNNVVVAMAYANESQKMVTTVKPFTNYSVQMAVLNDAGPGPLTKAIQIVTPEAAPSVGPRIENITREKFSTTFDIKNIDPADANGVILGYVLNYQCANSPRTRPCKATDMKVKEFKSYPMKKVEVKGLQSWTLYKFKILVYNAAGRGPFSLKYDIVTQEEVPSGPPPNLEPKVIASRRILLQWNKPPPDIANGFILKYIVKRFVSIGGKDVTTSYDIKNATEYLLKGLMPYTRYRFAIASVNSAGQSAFSESKSATTFEEAPASSPSITAVTAKERSLTLSIKNIDPADAFGKLLGYNIGYKCLTSAVTRKCGNETWKVMNLVGYPKSELILEGLKSWSKYEVRVQVYNWAGPSNFSNSSTAQTKEEAPSMSPNVTVNVESAKTIRVSWKLPRRDSINGLVTKIAVRTKILALNISSTIQYDKNISTAMVKDLKPYSKYALSVAVINSAGVGPFSKEMIRRTLEAAPGTKVNVTLLARGTRNFTLMIKPMNLNDANGVLLGYHLTYQCINTTLTRACQISTPKEMIILRTGTITELISDRVLSWAKYRVTVQIFNKAGRGPLSTPLEMTTMEELPGMVPTNFRILNIGRRNATLAWTLPPKDTHNGVLLGTLIDIYNSKKKTFVKQLAKGYVTKYTVLSLRPYTEYCFKSALKNAIGIGLFGKNVTSRTLEDVPEVAPVISSLKGARFNFTIYLKNISHEYANGVLQGYMLFITCIGTEKTRNCKSLGVQKRKIDDYPLNVTVITSLTSWTLYKVQMSVFNKAGVGPLSNVVYATTLEEEPAVAPGNITVLLVGQRSATLSLGLLSKSERNGIIKQYVIWATNLKTKNKTTLSLPAGQSNYTMTQLRPFSNYTLEVAAENTAGRGPFSPAIKIVTQEAAPEASPLILDMMNVTKTSIKIYIKDIDSTYANGILLGYRLQWYCINTNYTRDCASNQTNARTQLGYPRKSFLLTNLTYWTSYVVVVQIYNQVGFSQPVSKKTIISGEEIPSSSPKVIRSKFTGARRIQLEWDSLNKNNRNGVILKYRVIVYNESASGSLASNRTATEREIWIMDLKPLTTYSIKVAAINTAGQGPFSPRFIVKTKEAAPSPPRNVTTVKLTSTAIRVMWEEPLEKNGILAEYQIRYNHSMTDVKFKTTAAVPRSVILENLETFVLYQIVVRALSVTGKAGEWSMPTFGITKQWVPTCPRNVTFRSVGKRDVVVSWIKPEKAKGILKYYKINLKGSKSYNSSFSQEIIRNSTCSQPMCSMSISGLYPGTTYGLKAVAATIVGEGGYSEVVTKVTEYDNPLIPHISRVEGFADGGNEINVTLHPVPDINGPISSYQVIVEDAKKGCGSVMNSFPTLLSKTDANEKGLPYYLALEVTSTLMPLDIKITPGIDLVSIIKADLATPGTYNLYFRAKTVYGGEKTKSMLYSNATVTCVRRENLRRLPKPSVGSKTLVVPLPRFTFPRAFIVKYYMVIVVEKTTGTPLKDPNTYNTTDLKPYDEATYKAGHPYVTAVLLKSEFDAMKEFEVGNGKVYKTTARRKRQTREIKLEYVNKELKPEKTYSVFVRAVSEKDESHSTPWTAELKTSKKPAKEGPDDNQIILIIAGIVVATVIIAIMIFTIIFLKRRNIRENWSRPLSASREPLEIVNGLELKQREPDYDDYFDDFDGDEDLEDTKAANIQLQKKEDPASSWRPEQVTFDTFKREARDVPTEPEDRKLSRNPNYPPVDVKDIVHYVKYKEADQCEGFQEEFSDISGSQLFSWEVAIDAENKVKNRFANIVAYDYTRVKLMPEDGETDYINANYIMDYDENIGYIATQAPTERTIPQFWQMVWEQEAPAIIMLTRCIEGNKRKSAEYWPVSGSNEYGKVTVTFLAAIHFSDYVITSFELRKFGSPEVRKLEHYHYHVWPDHGVPLYPTSLLSFRRRLRQTFPYETARPLIVHCSAGVGRSGTFIAVDTLISVAQRTKQIDVFNYVNYMRLQRPHMVQRMEQYKFIYESLLEITVCGITEVAEDEMKAKLVALQTVDKKSGVTGLSKEFTCLSYISPHIDQEEFSTARQSYNVSKNRDPGILPRNTFRVFLPCLDYVDGIDYINATFVDGFERDQFIATQAPLDSTIEDFWRMVVDRGSTIIVSLNNLQEGKTMYPKYWPEDGDANFVDLQTKLISSITINEDISEHVIHVNDRLLKKKIDGVHHLHFTGWSDGELPDPGALLSLVEEVQKLLFTGPSDSPLIVQCSTGGGRTGTFIAALLTMERFRIERSTDIFQVVKRIRQSRPQFVENEDQYNLLYKLVSLKMERGTGYSLI